MQEMPSASARTSSGRTRMSARTRLALLLPPNRLQRRPIDQPRLAVRKGKRQDRALPHQSANQPAFWPRIDFRRRRDLQQPSLGHHGDIGRQRHGLALIVGYIDHGGSRALMEFAEGLLHLFLQMPIKIGERLVKQHNVGRLSPGSAPALHADAARRRDPQASRSRHSLPAARSTAPPYLLAIALAGDAAHFEGCPHCRQRSYAARAHRTGTTIAMLRRSGGSIVCGIGEQTFAEMDRTVRRLLEAGDHPQHCRLATAGRPPSSAGETTFADFERAAP